MTPRDMVVELRERDLSTINSAEALHTDGKQMCFPGINSGGRDYRKVLSLRKDVLF